MQHQRYLNSQPRMTASNLVKGLLYIALFVAMCLWWFGFFYLGTAELESERIQVGKAE